ncbi:hypothetical protein BSIN_3236 [Burkholderia singularis]|uniref:Uncharacterized protein n=1 Tax=Burkholderia singularis TaxID=1503053 RepID=A0A238H427_9BURK|nr:hypothetical protein BSIN_3236 [Burkholderia singularis]
MSAAVVTMRRNNGRFGIAAAAAARGPRAVHRFAAAASRGIARP